METKTCTTCKCSKEVSEFYKGPRYKGGYKSQCKTCSKKQSVVSVKKYVSNPDNKEKIKERARQYREKNQEKVKWSVKSAVYKKLGISIDKETYDNLLAQQDGRCAICNEKPGVKALSLDHCHTSLKVRGFLCDNCNTALGKFKDDVTRLKNAISYLQNC